MDGRQIDALLGRDSLFFGKVIWLEQVDSTNTRLRELAEQGAAEGTVLLADEQTAGRGTGSRGFFSPRGEGLYLSVLLRPKAALSDLFTLTGWTAVAVRDGIEAASGAPCEIKWLNDICLNGRKVCGILTELPALDQNGADYVVVGVGVNVSQCADSFVRQGLDGIAASLEAEGYPVSRDVLAAAILRELERMYRRFPQAKADYLERYRAHCLMVGKRVRFFAADRWREGTAVDVDEDFALVTEDRSDRHTVRFGTVYFVREDVGV